MRKKDISPVTIDGIVNKYHLPHVGDDIALIDSLRKLQPLTEPRRMSLCLFIGICTDGIVTLEVNGKKRVASSKTVMIVTDESVVDKIMFSDDFDGFGLFISYKMLHDVLEDVVYMSDLFLLSHNHPVFDIQDEDINIAHKYFNSIVERIAMPKHRYRKEVIRLHVLALIYDFSNTFDNVLNQPRKEEKQSRGERIFVNFVQLVERNFREQRQVQWYAKEMQITPKYLSEVISSVSRRTPNEWIDKFVTTEMRNQLRHTNKKMCEIAQELNFPSQSFFGKYFKENVGVSPSEYRNGIEN
ncbi:MAG: helix-turn-helix transcriptional regulator [Prevotella sp.]|nr:helix-turn-helix transcriptional regulator [Prevotella sp.]